MPENKLFTDHLKVVFTDGEIQKKGLELAQTMGEADQLEIEKKSVVSDYKGRIDAKKTIIKKLQDEVNNGYAYLPVKCELKYNEPGPGQATIVRLDNGETVNVRDMTNDERQVRITEFDQIEQADSPFEKDGGDEHGIDETPLQATNDDGNRTELSADEQDGLLSPSKYTSDEFKKEFQNATAVLDAEKFGFAAGRLDKMANKEKIKILRQDKTGTVFTMGEMSDGLIFFDKSAVLDELTTVELIDGRITQLEAAIENEPDSPGKEAWEKEIVDLKAKRVKQVRKERDQAKRKKEKPEEREREIISSDNPEGVIDVDPTTLVEMAIENDTLTPEEIEQKDADRKKRLSGKVTGPGLSGKITADGEPSTKKSRKKNENPAAEFTTRPAEWFIERIGKNIEAKSPTEFNGEMEVEDQEQAEYLSGVCQNSKGYTFRDVQ